MKIWLNLFHSRYIYKPKIAVQRILLLIIGMKTASYSRALKEIRKLISAY